MNPLHHRPSTRRDVVDGLRMRAWLQTRRDRAELEASVVYWKLMLRVGLRSLPRAGAATGAG